LAPVRNALTGQQDRVGLPIRGNHASGTVRRRGDGLLDLDADLAAPPRPAEGFELLSLDYRLACGFGRRAIAAVAVTATSNDLLDLLDLSLDPSDLAAGLVQDGFNLAVVRIEALGKLRNIHGFSLSSS
jgi:hypothetical protein